MNGLPLEPVPMFAVPAPPGWFAVWRDDAGELLEPVPMFAQVFASADPA